jgi:calcium-dependent protein kinase
MHSKGFINRDIKAENILVSYFGKDDIIVKLCDFGLCISQELITQEDPIFCKEVVGSPYYIAPEVLKKEYNQSCDVWSIGVLLHYLLTQTFPYNGQTNDDIIKSIVNDEFHFQNLKAWS